MTFLEKIKAKRAAENGAATAPAVQAANAIVENATEKAEKKASPLQGILARKKAAEAAKAAEKAAAAAEKQRRRREYDRRYYYEKRKPRMEAKKGSALAEPTEDDADTDEQA